MAKESKRSIKPSMNPESRDMQMASLAYDLAEKQLLDGTASPSVIGHFLKIASKRETIELDILEKQKVLTEAKTASLGKDRDAEVLAKAAMEAMTKYRSSEQ